MYKEIIWHNQVGFIMDYKVHSMREKLINVIYNTNSLKKKKYVIILINAEKAFEKNQHKLMIKFSASRNRRKLPQLDKECFQKTYREQHT